MPWLCIKRTLSEDCFSQIAHIIRIPPVIIYRLRFSAWRKKDMGRRYRDRRRPLFRPDLKFFRWEGRVPRFFSLSKMPLNLSTFHVFHFFLFGDEQRSQKWSKKQKKIECRLSTAKKPKRLSKKIRYPHLFEQRYSLIVRTSSERRGARRASMGERRKNMQWNTQANTARNPPNWGITGGMKPKLFFYIFVHHSLCRRTRMSNFITKPHVCRARTPVFIVVLLQQKLHGEAFQNQIKINPS